MDTDTWHVLVNRHSNLALDVQSASTVAAAPLTQWTRNDRTNQQFRFVPSDGGVYRIVARHSGLALDVYERNEAEGADIVQWEDRNGPNQQFSFQDMGGDYYRLVNSLSGKALAPDSGSAEAGTRITQYLPSNSAAQQWRLVGLEPIAEPGGGDGAECGAGTPNATVTGSAGAYRVNGANFNGSYRDAINRALSSLNSNRSSPQRVTVFADGSIGASQIVLPSNTIFEVCGTLTASNVRSRGAIEAMGVRNVSIPHLTLRGNPGFGMRFRDVHNLHLGQIDIRLSSGGGIGIRFERDRAGGGAAPPSTNVRMDHVYVSGTGAHGVETWHVDGLVIGTVIARNTAYAGLLLNGSRNARIGLVDGEGTGSGTGYATMRFANQNGLVGSSYPTNIMVDKVVSRGGGRGIFCVSRSGGVRIGEVELTNNGNNAILLENCYNVTIDRGTINGGGEVRLAARSEFPNNRDITMRNLTVRNASVRESPCGTNVSWAGLSHSGSGSVNVCR